MRTAMNVLREMRFTLQSTAPEGRAMSCFVTGGTGFIGRYLVERLAERGGRIHLKGIHL